MNNIEDIVREEMAGPGQQLGCHALRKNLREIHGLNIPRDVVYVMMADVDPSGLEERGGIGQAARLTQTGKPTSAVMVGFSVLPYI